jgi:hypothetical protein
LLLARAAQGECDVVVKGVLDGLPRGWVRRHDGNFQSDRASEAPISEATLRAQTATAGQERTYGCVPPGSGERIGIDLDGDGSFDQTERDAGSDPADPTSVPPGATTTSTSSTTSTSTTLPVELTVETTALRLKSSHKINAKLFFDSSTVDAAAGHRIVVPLPGTPDDPRINGGGVVVQNADGSLEHTSHYLFPSGWKLIGPRAAPKGYKYSARRGGDTWIKSVTLRADHVVVKGLVHFSLDEPSQGHIAVRVYTGFTHWCGEAAAKVGGTPRSTARNDQPGRFIGQPKAPAPAACAPLL